MFAQQQDLPSYFAANRKGLISVREVTLFLFSSTMFAFASLVCFDTARSFRATFQSMTDPEMLSSVHKALSTLATRTAQVEGD